MEMKINPQFIRDQRQRRAWSQQHLADASGLSLRTVQRVEANGRASFETAQAMAAVFDVSVPEVSNPASRPGVRTRITLTATLSVAVAALAILLSTPGMADLVMLDLHVSPPEQPGQPMQLAVRDGEPATVQFSGQFRLEITPILDADEPGSVNLMIHMAEYADGEYLGRVTPQLRVPWGSAGSLHFESGIHGSLKLEVTPTLLSVDGRG